MEEQGDLLLQVALQTQIAGEEGRFRPPDVIARIISKLIRRHPHVFGDATVNSTDEVLANWEAIKRAEREGNAEKRSPLAGVPKALPALSQAEAYLDRMSRLAGRGSTCGAVGRAGRPGAGCAGDRRHGWRGAAGPGRLGARAGHRSRKRPARGQRPLRRRSRPDPRPGLSAGPPSLQRPDAAGYSPRERVRRARIVSSMVKEINSSIPARVSAWLRSISKPM